MDGERSVLMMDFRIEFLFDFNSNFSGFWTENFELLTFSHGGPLAGTYT